MRPRSKTARFSKPLRLSLVGLCVAAHLAVSTGFPLPAESYVVNEARPFPCQHHHCGCRSADQCWRSCCCMSMQEKLTWARQHGVTPPSFVVAAAAQEADDEKADTQGDRAHNGCSAKVSMHQRSCCSSSAGKAAPHGSHRRQSENRVEWVSGVQAQKCQGLTLTWMSAGCMILPPARVALVEDPLFARWFRPSVMQFWPSHISEIDSPPPWIV